MNNMIMMMMMMMARNSDIATDTLQPSVALTSTIYAAAR